MSFKKFVIFQNLKFWYVSLKKIWRGIVTSSSVRVRLVREFWRGGEIFNLKCLVQFLEGKGRGGEQILLHCQNYPYINLKSQYYPCNNIYYYYYYYYYVILSLKQLLLLLGYRLYYLVTTFITHCKTLLLIHYSIVYIVLL